MSDTSLEEGGNRAVCHAPALAGREICREGTFNPFFVLNS